MRHWIHGLQKIIYIMKNKYLIKRFKDYTVLKFEDATGQLLFGSL